MSMSPKKSSTEQLYALALDREVEDVSGEAEPSYHKNYAVPPALAILQKITSNKGHITIEDIDYQITKVELKPLRAHGHDGHGHHHHAHGDDHGDGEYMEQMKIVHDRRSRRNFASSEFHTQVAAKQYHDAFHTYVAETTENNYQPVTLTPKKSSDGGTPIVLEIDGVDYFLKDNLDAADAKSIQAQLNVPAKASVDQWPEEVVIYEPSDQDGKYVPRTYIRGDVLPVDGGEGFDHRLLPREKNVLSPDQAVKTAGAGNKKKSKKKKSTKKKATKKKATKPAKKKSKKKRA